jgi:hypothetical protein
MGRSGSSALCRALALCGGVLHENVLGATAHNERGHWEWLEALELNDAYLKAHGSSWYDIGLRCSDHAAAPHACAAEFTERIRALLRASPPGRFLVVKEPRITALAAPWLAAARLERFEISFAIPVRHPFEVCASLAHRDALPETASVALWLKYNLLAERASRPYPRVFIRYDELLADWRGQIERASRALGLPLQPDAAAIEGFLTSTLRHNVSAEETLGGSAASDVGALYASLCAAARDQPLDERALEVLYDLYRCSIAARGNEFRCERGRERAAETGMAGWPLDPA